jgi:hypothetical protein
MSLPGTVTKLVEAMPFGGKRHVAAMHRAGFQAALRGNREFARGCKEMLENEAVKHIFATFMGAVVVGVNTYNSFRYGGAAYPVEAAFDSVYTLANLGSAYVQSRMTNNLNRAIDTHTTAAPAEGIPPEVSTAEYDVRPTIGQRTTHILGNLAFFATATHGMLSAGGAEVVWTP